MDKRGEGDQQTTKDPVVDMAARQARQRFAPLGQIEGYWDSLRGQRMMPLRSEIDPRGLKGTLEFCFVLERIAPGLARLRVAGSHLGDLMGMEVRGMPISSFLTADARQKFAEALEEVFETPSRATVTLSAETGFGRPELKAEMVLLPVRSDLGDTSRILGGLVSDGDIGRAPRRFNVDTITLTPIIGEDVPAPSTAQRLRQDDFRSTRGNRPFDTPAQSQPAMAHEGAGEYRQPLPDVPYLRVVK